MTSNQVLNSLDLLAILAISLILSAAFGFQVLNSELPCALCVMQRMGLYAISYGLVLNLCQGRTTKNYLLVIAAAVINSAIALLQVILHIVPGSGSYGSAIFGLHMYSWNFIIGIGFIIYSVAAGLFSSAQSKTLNHLSRSGKIIISLLLLTLIANIISAGVECGPYLCPSDPQSYWLIDIFSGKPWN